jgi:hypothetical protein
MNNQKVLNYLGFLFSWIALIVQFILMMQNRVVGEFETIVRFFSFFTILSNLLVALSFTAEVFKIFTFFRNFKTKSAIVVYISIVAIVYNVILRFLWQPIGLQRIIDELLHVVNPILYILFWMYSKDKIFVSYRFVTTILIFPSIYLISILVLGSFSNYYPYPFIDVFKIGLSQALLNSFFVLLAFVIVAIITIKYSRSKE